VFASRTIIRITTTATVQADDPCSQETEATATSRQRTAHALITLEYLGYVIQSHGRYRLRAAVLSLGCPVLSRLTSPG
jgi:DNA-binding IclR family transcriptional regulator